MPNLTSILSLSLLPLSLLSIASMAKPVEQPPRWVKVDDVRVRSGSSAEHKVLGTLPRGAHVILKDKIEHDGFCLIEGDGQYGYVACQFLSAEIVARAKSGEAGIPLNQRWAGGNPLTVREAPRQDATVVSRLHLNSVVSLIREDGTSGYCEIQTANIASGFTACRYLVKTPVVLANVRGDTSLSLPASPDYNPERAFWLTPGWWQLEAYVNSIKDSKTKKGSSDPWPRDEALEKMKAHLALGMYGSKPRAYADWSELKRKAAQDLDLSREANRLLQANKKVSDEQWRRQNQMEQFARELQGALSLEIPPQDANNSDSDPTHIIRLVRELEFASIKPSLFLKDSDIAPPHAGSEELSGRFGIIYRQLVTPRPKPKKDEGDYSSPGLYDMLKRTQALVRSVQLVRLFRDGKIVSEPSVARSTETLWREVDEAECEGWSPGFSFGDADTSIWHYFNEGASPEFNINSYQKESRKRNPEGSVYQFYLPVKLDNNQASITSLSLKLDRKKTGFISGNHLYYDLNKDGIADIAIWEGTSKGPGHIGGTTTTDDRWYRLALVNMNGAWKILGSDSFGYGCGC
nr:SH3 domain-containing protein [uncultured Undibacterium sp.]